MPPGRPYGGRWGGAPLREGGKPPKLISLNQLNDQEQVPALLPREECGKRLGFVRPVRFWPRLRAWFLVPACLAVATGLGGCGGATAPCPTPTTELDSLRTVAESLEREVDRETAESRKLEARHDAAARRVEAAQAGLDSLAGAGSK